MIYLCLSSQAVPRSEQERTNRGLDWGSAASDTGLLRVVCVKNARANTRGQGLHPIAHPDIPLHQ